MSFSKNIILFYNLPSSFYPEEFNYEDKDYLLTTDQDSFSQANIIIFYIQELKDEPEKLSGQYWIAWYYRTPQTKNLLFNREVMEIFDLIFSDDPMADLFTSKTDGEKEIKQQVNSLNNIIHVRQSEKRKRDKKIKELGSLYLCSFADSRFINSLERLYLQATLMDIFKDIYVCTEYELDESFLARFGKRMNIYSKGFGYWIWKPHIILKTLAKMKENEVLLYLDAGCHLNPGGCKRLIDYWEKAAKSKYGILVTELEEDRQEYKWTKGYILDFFQVRGNKEICRTPQYQSGVIFIRNDAHTRNIIKQWFNTLAAHPELADDSPSHSKNEKGFIANRHDQSVFSVLCKLNKATTIPISDCFTKENWISLYKQAPILIKRDL